jgi:hypothetical protein
MGNSGQALQRTSIHILSSNFGGKSHNGDKNYIPGAIGSQYQDHQRTDRKEGAVLDIADLSHSR